MISGLSGLMSAAERAARKRGRRLSTGHLLLAMFQHAPARDLFARHGVAETELLDAVAAERDEPVHGVALARERAQKLAASLGEGPATPLHLLLAIAREPRSAGYHCLERCGVRPTVLQSAALEALHGSAPQRPAAAAAAAAMRTRAAPRREPAQLSIPHAEARPRRALDTAKQQALAEETERRARAGRQRTQSSPDDEASALLAPDAEDASASSPAAAPVEAPLPAAEAPALGDLAAPAAAVDEPSFDAEPVVDSAAYALDTEHFPVLASLGRNLSVEAAEGRIDPVLGRDDEIERLMDVLARRRANCPILVGSAGVGKTAVVEGMALALLRDDMEAEAGPGSIVLEVSPGALVAGTGVRGALSERLSSLRAELDAAPARVILFIDEIHGVLGGDDGADSLANELKTALSRGEIACVGATTDAEYRRIFERDAALSRRFTRVEVTEPSPEVALEILHGVAPEYARHHGVRYEADALSAAVEMSVRYVAERRLPDKALALIDQAGARIRRRGGRVVDLEAVAQVVAEQTGVPLSRLLMRDGDCLLALETHLSERVVGQGEAVRAIAAALRKSAAGFRGSRPLGTFLFLGPTGVGKTEMAKAIGELLFPAAEITRFDMSELSEAHTVARLLGAPPGYVGHENGGQLTEAVRLRPYQLVLLDEIEKAHPDVLLSLLPLLDEGRLTDGLGRTVDFRNTVIVMTSNLGAHASAARSRIGFGASDADAGRAHAAEAALAAVRAALPPELYNRIDEPLCFHPLGKAEVRAIARMLVSRVGEVLAREHGAELCVDDSAIEALIAAGGYDPELGARPMRRVVGRLLEAPLAELTLGGGLGHGAVVEASGVADVLRLELREAAAFDAAE